MRRGQHVVRTESGTSSYRRSFLSDTGVQETRDQPGGAELGRTLLESPYQEHPAEQLEFVHS
jgi:hypothetical protein